MEPKLTVPELSELLGITRQGVFKKLRENGISALRKNGASYLTHRETRQFFEFDFDRKTIAFHIIKGGTGKTTHCMSVGIGASARYGARVLMIDTDPQSNLTESLNINPEDTEQSMFDPYEFPAMIDLVREDIDISRAIVNVLPGLDLIPSRIENSTLDSAIMLSKEPIDKIFSKRISKIIKNYDLILIDCPPTLGQSVTASLFASDLIVSPIIPSKYAFNAIKILSNEIALMDESYGKKISMKILINNYDKRKTRSQKDYYDKLVSSEKFSPLRLKSEVSTNQEFENTLKSGRSIFDTTRKTYEKTEIDAVIQELLGISLR